MFSKFILAVLFVTVIGGIYWLSGRNLLKGLAGRVLWAASIVSACAGLMVLFDSEGNPVMAFAGGMICLFAAYVVKVALSSRA